jgi:predicted metal-dependent hydrolase
MALANKLGSQYTAVKDKVNIKKLHIKIDEAEFELRVRVPLKQEMESINEAIIDVDETKVQALYDKLSAGIKKTLEEGGEEFIKAINKDKDFIIVKDNDIIIDGNSIRNTSTLSIMWENKVEHYFHLLVSEIGEPINETFEQINQEFPEEVIKQIVNEIEKAIKPTYDSVKKN